MLHIVCLGCIYVRLCESDKGSVFGGLASNACELSKFLYFSSEMSFECVTFERVVAQLKDVVIFLRSVCWAYVWSYSVVKLLL